MEISKYYENLISEPENFDKFFSSGIGKSGSIFSDVIGTNFRSIYSFSKMLIEFSEAANVPRELWARDERGQELQKHRVKRLEEAGLIIKNSTGFSLSNTGHVLYDLTKYYCIDNKIKQGKSIVWFITLILIASKTFNGKSKYLLKVSKSIGKYLDDLGYDINLVCGDLYKLCYEEKPTKINQLINNDLFWLLTFINDDKFCPYYLEAEEWDRNMLKMTVSTNIQNCNYNDLIAKKFSSGSVKNVSGFLNECKLLYYILIASKENPEDLFSFWASKYSMNESINIDLLEKVYRNNKSVIDRELSLINF